MNTTTLDPVLLAYLAGAMDADGHLSIKRVWKHKDGPSRSPLFHEIVGLGQVVETVPAMLKASFGGKLLRYQPPNPNRRAQWKWSATLPSAVACAQALLPYLRIKRRQAELILELRSTKTAELERAAYWFEQEHPDWRDGDLLTIHEVFVLMGYARPTMVAQAIRNGTLLATPYDLADRSGPRVPRLLVDRILRQRTPGAHAVRSPTDPRLLAWRERLFEECRLLNKTGVDGTSIFHRTGVHAEHQHL